MNDQFEHYHEESSWYSIWIWSRDGTAWCLSTWGGTSPYCQLGNVVLKSGLFSFSRFWLFEILIVTHPARPHPLPSSLVARHWKWSQLYQFSRTLSLLTLFVLFFPLIFWRRRLWRGGPIPLWNWQKKLKETNLWFNFQLAACWLARIGPPHHWQK